MVGSPTSTIRHSNKYFLIAFGLLNILSFTLFLCGLSFLLGLTVSKWQLPLGFILALIANYYAAGFFMPEKRSSSFLKSGVAIVVLIVSLVLFSGCFYDVSYDGQWYHQETVYNLKQGYNPAYQTIAVPPDEAVSNVAAGWCTGVDKPIPNAGKPAKPAVNGKYLNINHFGKATEILNAAFYQLTNRIETAKAVNSILLVASFFLCLSLLFRINQIGVRKKWLLAGLLSFNPVTVLQLLTFCVDGNLGSLLLCLLVTACLLFFDTNRYYLLLLASLITVTINIKFTGLVFTGIYCAGFILFLFVYKKKDTLKKVLTVGIISLVIGIFCCGFNPYVTNTVQKHNIFYGLDETNAAINGLTPPLFKGLNRFERLFLSLTAHQGWHSADAGRIRNIIKVPFTFNKEDIRETGDAQQELSTFGPFFSGTLLFVIILFAASVIYLRKTEIFKLSMSVFLIILFTVLIIPASWWGRFVPQFWLLPIIILFIGEFIAARSVRFIRGIIYLSLGLNVVWALLSIIFYLFVTVHVNYQMAQIKALNKPINVEYCPFDNYKCNRLRFYEAGIPFHEKNVSGMYIYNIIGSNTRFDTPAPLPELPKSFLLKLAEKINGAK